MPRWSTAVTACSSDRRLLTGARWSNRFNYDPPPNTHTPMCFCSRIISNNVHEIGESTCTNQFHDSDDDDDQSISLFIHLYSLRKSSNLRKQTINSNDKQTLTKQDREEKTEVMWCSSTRRLSQLPNSSIVVAGANVHPVSTVRDLGVYMDSDLGAATHVRKTLSHCFAALRQLHLRRYVTDDCFRSLVVSLIYSRLDYGNFVLVGLPAYLQRQLQSVLNAAARLVFRLRRYDHITDALAILHWLRVP